MFINIVNPHVGSYTKMDYSKDLGQNALIVKYGLDHFNRYSYSDGEVKFVNQNPQKYDLYARKFYQEAKEKLLQQDAADIPFSSEMGDPRRVLARKWKRGLVFASIEGIPKSKEL